MAIKGTPAQLLRMIDALANNWTTEQVKQAFGGKSHVETHALRDENVLRAGTVSRRGFHADAQGYKVNPILAHRMGDYGDR